jgi:uncharacterized membrane protein YidH (DUF202 family)
MNHYLLVFVGIAAVIIGLGALLARIGTESKHLRERGEYPKGKSEWLTAIALIAFGVTVLIVMARYMSAEHGGG